MPILKRCMDLLSSFGLTVAILFFMFLLTLFGTLVQETSMSLREAQRVYFESWGVIHNFAGPINIPLPGGVTLMLLLSINLICGGIVRMRWDLRRTPILITHFGIAFMMLAGLVKFTASNEGLLALYEGEQAAEYYDAHLLELVVYEPLENGEGREYIVSADVVSRLQRDDKLTITHAQIPFDLEITHFMLNCVVEPSGDSGRGVPVVDGYCLRERPPVVKMNQRNLPGCYATARIQGEDSQVGLLWVIDRRPDFEVDPWTVNADGKQWGVKLRHKSYPMPFEVRVDDFRAEFHPGSSMAKSYESDITVFDGDAEFQQHIVMNQPLRKEGYILFQTNWGPQEGGPNQARMYSVFSVVTNPSDKWPEYSCWIIGFGLLWHFGLMLMRYINKEQRARAERRAAAEVAS